MKPADILLLGAISVSAFLVPACGDGAPEDIYAKLRGESDAGRRALIARYIECVERADAGERVDATAALALAVALDYPDGVRRFLDEGADASASVAGTPLLAVAALQTRNPDVVEMLAKEIDSPKSALGALLVRVIAADANPEKKSSAGGAEAEVFADAGTRAKMIERLVSCGADVNASDGAGASALKLAVAKKDGETMRLLLNRGASADAGALAAAVSAGDAESADLLLSCGADAEARVGDVPALAFAVGKGDVKTARVLLNRGADPNSPGAPLAAATAAGSVELARLLLDRGADANGGNAARGMPLFGAIAAKSDVLTELLVARGADVREPSILREFVKRGNAEAVSALLAKKVVPPADIFEFTSDAAMVKRLVEGGADPSAALPPSVARGDRELAAWLLSHGAKPSAELVAAVAEADDFALVRAFVSAGAPATPAFPHFLEKKNEEAVAFLLERGADPNVEVGGVPAMLFAVRGNYPVLVRELAEKGADATLALPHFVAEDDLDTVVFLLRKGADPNVEVREGVPAVAVAADNGNGAMAKALVNAGADAAPALRGFIARKDAETVEFLRGKTDPAAFSDFPELEPAVVFAARKKNADLVKALVEAGANPALVLGRYAEAGDDVMTEWLIRKGASPRSVEGLAEKAARSGKISLVKSLVEAGADPTSALAVYVERQDEEMTRWLLEKGADATCAPNGVPVVVSAARAPSPAVMKRLVEAGADASLVLPIYVGRGDASTVDYLLGKGANPNAKTSAGISAVAAAADRRSVAIMEMLVNAGGNASDALPYFLEGQSAQDAAALDFLLEKGADAKMSVRGVPAVIFAAGKRNSAAVKKLVEAGANATIALPWFAENKRQSFEIAEFLLARGADPNTMVGVVPVSSSPEETSARSAASASASSVASPVIAEPSPAPRAETPTPVPDRAESSVRGGSSSDDSAQNGAFRRSSRRSVIRRSR